MTSLINRNWNVFHPSTRLRQIDSLSAKLTSQLGEGARVITDISNRRIYSRDLADLPRVFDRVLFHTTPLLVVQPRDVNDIAQTLRLANEERIPVFPRGVASSAYGGPVPTTNGIVVDLSTFRSIDFPNRYEKTVNVDAGARLGDIEDVLAQHNLALFTYPSNRHATIGGWVAGGGYGLNGFKYGHVSKYIAGLQLVTPQGEIKTVHDGHADFLKYFGTEGLMGIITRVRLRVREQALFTRPHLLSFDSDASAFALVREIASLGIQCASIEFYDIHLIQLLNQHRRVSSRDTATSSPAKELHLSEKPSLLVFIDDAETEKQFNQLVDHQAQTFESPTYVAGHMWSDRFFPMKIRSLGPSLLAAEDMLPLDRVAAFLAHFRELAEHLGVELATESHILETPEGIRVLAMPMFLTDIRRFNYAAHIAAVSALDRIASTLGGKPYNLGIWHAPFALEHWGKARFAQLRAFKRDQDPRNILNPGKFFRVRSRYAGIPGILFHPVIFKMLLDLLAIFARLIFYFLRFSPEKITSRRQDIARPQLELGVPAGYDLAALARTATECASCGACVSICPAYLHTHDERVTGRAKMWLARKLVDGQTITQSEADAAWLCVRCRACAEVCQVQLPLMTAYEKLESELQVRFGLPIQLIDEFVAGMERDPEYRAKVGLTLPVGLMEQRWQKLSGQNSEFRIQPAVNHQQSNHPTHQLSHDETIASSHYPGGKYHIETRLAPGRQPLLGKFEIERDEQCISCGQCAEACVYGVHSRNPIDRRRMNQPKDELCRGCFRCVQECPRNALTISFDTHYARTGRGAFTADVISSLQHQAEEGKLPVLGAGYRGPFAGPALDSMWTDLSEIVRPTRDGIHGREYISTVVDLGRRPLRLEFRDSMMETPPFMEIPLPILLNHLPIHKTRNVMLALARAARRLGTYAMISRCDWFDDLEPYAHNIVLAVQADELDPVLAQFPIIEIEAPALAPRIKRLAPDSLVMIRVGGSDLDLVAQLARDGAEILHLAFNSLDPVPLFEQLPRIHARLVQDGLRDSVTLLASGAVAMAEHPPKTILLGADAVAIDLPLLVALECALDDPCFADGQCPHGIENISPAWGEQRIVNLMASWRNQLLEVMGAMGMREVRRIRGERGRAMLKSDLDAELFAPIFE